MLINRFNHPFLHDTSRMWPMDINIGSCSLILKPHARPRCRALCMLKDSFLNDPMINRIFFISLCIYSTANIDDYFLTSKLFWRKCRNKHEHEMLLNVKIPDNPSRSSGICDIFAEHPRRAVHP